ncbi:MAG: DUF3095 family protein, partial [Spirochaetes bacterium]|nr:DUF3095 family protein [Spirochaetota bacterium]
MIKSQLTDPFYTNIQPINDFHQIYDESLYYPLPDNWYIIITDIIQSTKAVDAGKYKEVNIAGSLGIMAISNIVHSMNFPYIFGGDGMTYLIPESLYQSVCDILLDTKHTVKNIYDLDLRVGMVKMDWLRNNGYEIKVAKYQASQRYQQALLTGNGLEYAERLVKAKMSHNPYLIPDDHQVKIKADFDGFSCRWKNIPSH